MAAKKAKKTVKKAATRKVAKATVKKAVARKPAAAKKTVAKVEKKVAKKAAPKKLDTSAIKKSQTKSQVMAYIAESTDLSKKEVAHVLDVLANIMHRHLRKGAAGEFTVPGLMKCIVKNKPATKARKGINPFNGEEVMFKAKPARSIVKIRPLKKLKEMTEK